MSIALSEFWTRLVRSGIADAAGCKRLAMEFTKANGGTPPSDAKSLAKFMIVRGKLNRFQARSLIADQATDLRFGGYLRSSGGLASPMNRWMEATRLADGQTGYLLQTEANELSGGREQWAAAHLEVISPALQAFELEATPPSVCVFSQLPPGQLLHEAITTQGTLSAHQTCQIGIAIAEAIESLHTRPLIHGEVRADRVWLSDSGEAVLLRDPSGPPVIPSQAIASSSSMRWFSNVEPPYGYAAPEFINSEQVCDHSTDLYSLGCLLYRAVSGKLPVDTSSPEDAIALHGTETPVEVANAVALGEQGDPLYRVIAFAMAKSRDARFSSAGQVAAALRATLPLLKDDPKAAVKTKEKSAVLPPVEPASPVKAKRANPPTVGQTGDVKKQHKSSVPAPTEKRPDPVSEKPSARVSASRPAKPQTKRKEQSPVPKPTYAAPEESESKADLSKAKSRDEVADVVASPPVGDAVAPAVPQPPAPAPDSPNSDSPNSDSREQPISTESVAATPPRATRRRKKKKSKAPLWLGALCIAILMLMIGLLVHDPTATTEDEPVAEMRRRMPTVVPSVTGKTVEEDAKDLEPLVPVGYTLTASDRLLYVPPFPDDENDASLTLLPPGPAAILSIDLASIAATSGGSTFSVAIEPEIAGLLGIVSKRAGVPIGSVRRCSAAFHAGKAGWPEVSLAIELKEPQTLSELTQFWKASPARTPDGATIYAGDAPDSDAYYVPDPGETVSRFAVGSIKKISEVAADEGAAILLPRSLQQLWNSSSTEADFVFLLTPNFLFADGREMLISSAPELIAPLKSVLIPDVAAAFVTADVVDDQVFLETRLTPSGGVSEAALMRSLDATLKRWPTWAEEFIVDSVPDTSWRLLASRMPSMMRFVSDQARVGVSDGSVVANTYLPANALSQLTIATLLAMNTKSGGSPAVAAATAAKTFTMEELLNRKMSVSFDQESLEFAIDAIVGDFKRNLPPGATMPPVRIIGGDLQKMGITQNQQVRDFSKSDTPLRSVLTDLVLKANPDKSATGPRDTKQALIWVVTDDSENPGKKAILITTRQAAENKYSLPVEFQAQE